MKKISLPIQIAIGMLAGFGLAIVHFVLQWDTAFPIRYIKPIGESFIIILKALSIPLVVTGVIHGISGISNTKKLSDIGIKAVSLYILTTLLAVCIGLAIGSLIQPGKKFSSAIHEKFASQHKAYQSVMAKEKVVEASEELIPDNLFKAFANNNNLLFIVLFALLFAFALLRIDAKKRKIVVDFYDAINEIFREIIKLTMRFAPLGIFSLTYAILLEQTQEKDLTGIYEFLIGLSWYTASVVGGLCLMTFVVYPCLGMLFSQTSWTSFVTSIQKAQIVAFSTSSSPAALPTSIECAEKNLGISKSISNFVLSLGATINMDGTVLYQAIATLFIAQAYSIVLPIEKLATIAIYLTVSSFGMGGIPSVSLSTTAILLNMLGIPAEGIVLIIMPDRFLDMARTATNITGDLFVALTIDRMEKRKPV